MYGSALSEMQRHLVAGVHTINIGGTPIVLPSSERLQGLDLCGRCYLIAVINSGMIKFVVMLLSDRCHQQWYDIVMLLISKTDYHITKTCLHYSRKLGVTIFVGREYFNNCDCD